MAGAVKYLKDETGQKTSVLVPVKVWADLNTNYKKTPPETQSYE